MLDPGVVQRARVSSGRAGRAPGLRWLGPGAVVSVAYVDPGNFATNVQAGGELGMRLLWVVVLSSVAAMFVQYLAAKLGTVTGCSLPEVCRDRYPRWVTVGLWVQAEFVIVATDLAEVIGAAVALQLLVGTPLVVGGALAAVMSFALASLRTRTRRGLHAVVVAVLGVLLLAFVAEILTTGVDTPQVASGLAPSLGGERGTVLAAAIVGATVMPHAVYLHTGLASVDTRGGSLGARLRAHRRDILWTLGLAGLANALILVVAATVLHQTGGNADATLGAAYEALSTYGPAAAGAFALALLLSGWASSGVGTAAGDVVMAGFLRRRVNPLLRRALAVLPALALLASGMEPTRALVYSQTALAFGIPLALGPLLHLTARRAVMGAAVTSRRTTSLGAFVAVLISGLSVGAVLAA